MVNSWAPPAIMSSDVEVDSHSSSSTVGVFSRRAKTDPFGRGVHIYLGRTQRSLCPVAAILRYLAVHPAGDGPLLIFRDGTPLSREFFINEVKLALQATHIDHRGCSTRSFCIGAAIHRWLRQVCQPTSLKCWAGRTPSPTSCLRTYSVFFWQLVIKSDA